MPIHPNLYFSSRSIQYLPSVLQNYLFSSLAENLLGTYWQATFEFKIFLIFRLLLFWILHPWIYLFIGFLLVSSSFSFLLLLSLFSWDPHHLHTEIFRMPTHFPAHCFHFLIVKLSMNRLHLIYSLLQVTILSQRNFGVSWAFSFWVLFWKE